MAEAVRKVLDATFGQIGELPDELHGVICKRVAASRPCIAYILGE